MKAGFSKQIFPKKRHNKFYDFSGNYRFQLNNLQIKLPFLIHPIEMTKPFSRSCFIDYYGRLRPSGMSFSLKPLCYHFWLEKNISSFFFLIQRGCLSDCCLFLMFFRMSASAELLKHSTALQFIHLEIVKQIHM